MSNQHEFLALSNEICTWIQGKPKWAVRSSDAIGRKALLLLKEGARSFHENISEELRSQFYPSYSTGKSNLPSSLWIALIPRHRQVHNSMMVAICYGCAGEGAVVGVMDSVTMPQLWLPLEKRDPTAIEVNLNGPQSKFKFNNKFHNPVEFIAPLKNPKGLFEHANHSLEILNAELKRRYG